MNSFLADTMAIVLFLEKRRLPQPVKDIFNAAVNRETKLGISVVSLMEVGYLSEKKRINTSIHTILDLTNRNDSFFVQDVIPGMVVEAFNISSIPELHDRLITATASKLGIPLLTNDPFIIASKFVKTIW